MSQKFDLELDISSARRVAIAAQGLNKAKPKKTNKEHFNRVINDVGLVQLDSVQALCRSHYLVFFSRLGKYKKSELDKWIWHSEEVFESWAHEASVLPVTTEPFTRWKRDRARNGETWKGLFELANSQKQYVSEVMREVELSHPISASQLKEPRSRSGSWWSGRSDGQKALDWLFRIGEIGVRRDSNFSRSYVPFKLVAPKKILSEATPTEQEAIEKLILISARCNGLGTIRDTADYFRIKPSLAKEAVNCLVDKSELIPIKVEGWKEEAYLHNSALLPEKTESRALLSPFDSLIWCRPRIERLFGYRYRLEIYVPREKREFGYYVMPFLLNENLVARVDLKTLRSEETLVVKGVFLEEKVDAEVVCSELMEELSLLADFLNLSRIKISGRNKTANILKSLLKSTSG